MAQALTNSRASFAMLAQQHPWLRSVASFLLTLRPAWWLIRGYLGAWALWSMLLGGSRGFRPQSLKEYVLALVAVVVSVQLGRGWLRQRAVLRPLLVVANVAAVLVAVMAWGSGDGSYDETNAYNPSPGVSLDGAQVGNIFVYDADGKRINGVRLFAADGRPLGGDEDVFGPTGSPVGVVRDSSGAPVTNVYPRALYGQDPWQVTNPADPEVNQGGLWTPPMSIVPLMSSAAPTTTPTGAATAPAATAPVATASARPAPSTSTPPAPSGGPSPSVTRSGR